MESFSNPCCVSKALWSQTQAASSHPRQGSAGYHSPCLATFRYDEDDFKTFFAKEEDADRRGSKSGFSTHSQEFRQRTHSKIFSIWQLLLRSIFYLYHLISQKVRFGKGDRCEIGLSRTCLYLGKVWCKMQHRCLYQAHRQVVGNS